MERDELWHNICAVRERAAAAANGRAVTIVAATKTVPISVINAAIESGITDIGENRAQEFADKRDGVRGAVWHFIGTLQSNKAKQLVGRVALIQSVNSRKLAELIGAIAVSRGVLQDVLIEINAGGDSGKTGAPIEQADALISGALGLDGIRVRGIMSVPPIGAADDVYIALNELYSHYNRAVPDFDILSVGMSGDYERAIRFGSNMVRIGSAIFGARVYSPSRDGSRG